MTYAVTTAILAGALAGLIGVQVVQRRLAYFTLALTHATFPGVITASLLGLPILLGGVAAGVLMAAGVSSLSRIRGQDRAAATGVLLSGGFALGAGLIATRDGFSRDLSAFLTGSILTTGPSDVWTVAVVLAVVAAVLAAGARTFTYTGFDPAGARAAGVAVGAADLVLLLTVLVAVVALLPAVGTILALALIVAPAAAARRWTDRPAPLTALAVIFGVASGLLGLLASARLDVAAGGAITLTATAILLVSILARSAWGFISRSLVAGARGIEGP